MTMQRFKWPCKDSNDASPANLLRESFCVSGASHGLSVPPQHSEAALISALHSAELSVLVSAPCLNAALVNVTFPACVSFCNAVSSVRFLLLRLS